MIEVLVTLVPSLFWIFYRCLRLLTTPVDELVDDLQIEIPHSPSVCIDSIQEDCAIIHWDIETLPEESLNYILIIDSKQVTRLLSTSCKLTNLNPGQTYEVQIIAENPLTNFRSQSSPVLIQALDSEIKDFDLEIIPNTTSKVQQKSNELKHDSSIDIESLSVEEIKSIKSSDILSNYLNLFQNELSKINQEYQKYQQFIEKENIEVNRQLKVYKQEFEEETDSKLKKDNDVKSLEKTKNELTFSKSKLLHQISTIQHSVDLFTKKLSDYEHTIQKLTKRNTSALNNESKEVSNIKAQIKAMQRQMEDQKLANEKLEEEIKQLVNEKKELGQLASKLKPYFDIVNNPPANNESTIPPSIFTKFGTVQKQVLDAIAHICELMPLWSNDINQELEHYNQDDSNWRSAFRQEIKKYVDIHQLLESYKKQEDPTYQPVKTNEYQASIDFGGYANALPRMKPGISPGTNGGRINRNFSPQTSIHSIPSIVGNNDDSSFYNHYGQVYSREKVNDSGNTSHIDQIPMDSIDQAINTSMDDQYTGTNLFASQSEAFIQSPVPSQQEIYVTPTISANNQLLGFPYDDQLYTGNLSQDEQMYNQDNAGPFGFDLNSLLYSYTSPRLPNNNLTPARTPVLVTQPMLQSQQPILPQTQQAPQSAPAVWNPTPHHLGVNDLFTNNVNVSTGSLTTSSSLDKNANQFLTSNIWNGREDINGHTRNLSNNQIWRNDNNMTNHHFNLGEFEPFGNSIKLGGNMNEDKKKKL